MTDGILKPWVFAKFVESDVWVSGRQSAVFSLATKRKRSKFCYYSTHDQERDAKHSPFIERVEIIKAETEEKAWQLLTSKYPKAKSPTQSP